MDENRIEGVVKQGVGRAKDAYGGATGDLGVQADGKLDQIKGAVQDGYGKGLDQARDLIDSLGDMVAKQPWTALGGAALAGLMVGMMLGGGSDEKVVYVRK